MFFHGFDANATVIDLPFDTVLGGTRLASLCSLVGYDNLCLIILSTCCIHRLTSNLSTQSTTEFRRGNQNAVHVLIVLLFFFCPTQRTHDSKKL